MSDSVESPAATPSEPTEFPVPFSTFAATLRPQFARDATGRINGISEAGKPDEIWLKFLAQHHGMEKHTMTEWGKMIDRYRDEPAHPAGGA